MTIDSGLVARFRRQLARGEAVLFTGAGFSYAAVSKSGKPVPSADNLKRELWRLAFPSAPHVDEASQLGDVFELALSRAKNASRDLLNDLLQVDAERSPTRFKSWFSLPWYRHYTLNVDDLDEAIASHYSLQRPLNAISATTDAFISQPGLLSIHLNGRLRDFPNITFSIRQYGQRASQPDAWYQTLVADLLNHPIVFVGTVLEEPGLWQYIELRRQRSGAEVEMRPASYLVSPSLPVARAGLLKNFNINWINATEEEFFETVLETATIEAELGHAELRQRYQTTSYSSRLKPVSELREQEPPDDLSLFLMGRTPTWADLQEGFAVERWFERDLLADARSNNYSIILLTGTAASGKSTTAMRLALALEADGKRTYVFDATEGGTNVGSTVSAIKGLKPDVLLIDDVDVFGTATARLLRELSALPNRPLIIAAIRSSRLQGLDLAEELQDLSLVEITVPTLHDQDIDALLNALSNANRLGQLAGKTTAQRRHVFRTQAGRQLLVAMFYATSGQRLQDRVYSECEDLSGSSRLAYGMAALATSERQWLSRDELILGIGAVGPSLPGNQELNEIQHLIDRNLLLVNGRELRLRHRWIAETTIEFYIDNGLISNVVKAFAFVVAVKADPQMSWHSRERKLLRRVINHDYLIKTVANVPDIRSIYSFLEDQLSWDYHYWLQKGSLEVEVGDLALAENFLSTARSLAPEREYLVETEYAYLTLKNAAKHPHAPGASERAEAALLDLEDVMWQRGKDDSYPFHIYGSQGLSWARRMPATPTERRSLLARLLQAVERGLELHPASNELRRLRDDLKRESMMTLTE
jgi:Mrp family chromosome partitioning ATPase